MKKIRYNMMKAAIVCLSGFLLLSACGSSENNGGNGEKEKGKEDNASSQSVATKPENAMFGIKSAKIVYTYKSNFEEGTDIFWFDDYGTIAVLEINRTGKMGSSRITNTWTGKNGLVINHTNKSAAKSFFRSKDTEPPTIAVTREEDAKRVGYVKMAEEQVVGKSCTVWTNEKPKVKYWLWNNIELKVDNQSIGGAYILREAQSIEENIIIPESLFQVPAGYDGP